MDKRGPIGLLISVVAVMFALLLSTACEAEGVHSMAIFHPGGTQALHPSKVDPADLLVRGKVYVPVYSNIHWGGLDAITELSATVSIRNADAERSLVLVSVKYYDSLGKPIQEYLDGVMELDPMATVEFVIERPDTRGGSGANFLIDWGSPHAIAEPVTEAIMLGQIGNAGISFLSPGRPVHVIQPNSDAPRVQ